uniref:Uncharacterized protein n=1 Tax=Ditylenchus dipsaci TaxID=166011 RepID=A0A915E6Y5_9BILA
MGLCFSKSNQSRKPNDQRNCRNPADRRCSHSQHLASSSGNNQTTTKKTTSAPKAAELEPPKPEPIGFRDPSKIGQDNNLPYPLVDKMPRPETQPQRQLVTKKPNASPPHPPVEPTYFDSPYPGAQSAQLKPQVSSGDHDTHNLANPPPIGWNVDITTPYPLEDRMPKPENPLPYPLEDKMPKPENPLPYPLEDNMPKPQLPLKKKQYPVVN